MSTFAIITATFITGTSPLSFLLAAAISGAFLGYFVIKTV